MLLCFFFRGRNKRNCSCGTVEAVLAESYFRCFSNVLVTCVCNLKVLPIRARLAKELHNYFSFSSI